MPDTFLIVLFDLKKTNKKQKDVTLRHEEVEEDDGLFRPNVPRGILAEGETISDLTHRSLKRVNIILEAIRQHLVIEEIGVLLRVSYSCLLNYVRFPSNVLNTCS